MGQLAVSDGEIVRLAWEAEDRQRGGGGVLARRRMGRSRELHLTRIQLGGRAVFVIVVEDRTGQDVWDFTDGDAAWRAAIGWDGKGEPEGFAKYRRRGFSKRF